MKIVEWKISPDLIPHQDFHKGYWLNLDESNPWYYFFPAKRTYHLPTSSNFYNSLDRDLVNIVKLLHRHNIPTTPSCSGHTSKPDYYSEVYSRLEKNRLKIRNEGVVLYNQETGKKYFYKNFNYTLPWDLESFVNRNIDYQTNGVLGFVDSNGNLFNYLSRDYKCKFDEGITLVFQKIYTDEERRARWGDLYKSIHDYLLL